MRNRQFVQLDAVLLSGMPWIALGLHYETFNWTPEVRQAGIAFSVAALVVRLGIAHSFGLYRCLWRHASISELKRILRAGLVAAILTILLGSLGLTALRLAPAPLPLAVLVLDAILAVGVLAGPRLFARAAGARAGGSANDRRAIVVGAGAGGQMILRETRLNARLHLQVVAFADDAPEKQGQLLGGVKVLGTIAELPRMIAQVGADELIIAIPSASGVAVRKVLKAAKEAGIPARTMPALDDLISGRVKVSALRPVEIHDLLRREPVTTDLAAVRELASGRTVLVTGAGGSIGSELCRQIGALGPERLLVLDHSENQVFEISGELRERFPKLQLVPLIADIRDQPRVRSIMQRYKPYAVFHAAAHKHVPLMEENIVEAITNNVLGTRNIVEAALDADVRHLVSISTDKAVRPTSIMGATKRVAEKIVLHAALTDGRNFVSVRFGNVLGSRGSVIPTFLKQIAAGGPITITHPEMRRYFMTIPEAVQLVLQAGALGKTGDLFVLDMGEPVKIADLARDLIRLSGLEEGSDIEINFTGVRPGEKLYEEVFFGGENIVPTSHSKVLRVSGEEIDPEAPERIEAIIKLAIAHSTSDNDLRDLLRLLVPEFAREDARTNPAPRPNTSTGPSTVPPVKVPRPTLQK